MFNKDNIYLHEFVGFHAKIVKSSNPKNLSVEGKIVDETKKMFAIKQNHRKKWIPKTNSVFEVAKGDTSFIINGNYILMRPEDRLKEHRRIEKMIRNGEKYD